MQSFFYIYNTKHNILTPYHTQSNGQAKATNKMIFSIIKKIVSISHRDWYTQIPLAL